MHNGRDGALLAQAAKTHDFVVNIHWDQLYRGRGKGPGAALLGAAYTSAVRKSFLIFNRLAVGCLRKQPTRVVWETGGCLFFPPAPALAPVRTPVSEKVYESTVNSLSYFLTRLPCAALTTLVSTRESILFRVPPSFSMFPGRLVRFLGGRGFHQTTTIGLRRLELRLDYA